MSDARNKPEDGRVRAAADTTASETNLSTRLRPAETSDGSDSDLSRVPAGKFPGSRSAPQVFSRGKLLAGRYEILALLGHGGMGAVYKARDREVQRDVALKVIRPELADHPAVLQRFRQELILAREVTHRNVVRIYDIGEAEGVKFITMEFINGDDLSSLLKDGKGIAPDRAADIICQVCSGLQAAHQQGIIHRDLKPGNIMLEANSGRVVLMDFGLARSIEAGSMTQTGVLIGTIQYMSPEQAKTEHLDARSDIYTVGLIFYELLTGTSPYAAESAIASLMRRTQERAAPPGARVAGIPAALNDICSRCLEIDPANRYRNVAEMLADFEAWRHGARGASLRAVARNLRRRLRWQYVAAACCAVVVIAATLFFAPRLTVKPAAEPAPVTVLVADFTNHTGDPVFNGTLEPMFNVALEGAKFVSAFSRGEARTLAARLPNPSDKLDEQSARLVAISQGVGAVVTGSLSRRENDYKLSVEALDARTGKSIAVTDITAANKEEILREVPKLAAPIRKALGDTTPESAQLNAVGGAFTAASLEAVHLDAIGMQQQFEGKFEDALRSYTKAVEIDPNFAPAYSALSAINANLGNLKDAERYLKLAMEHEDRMTERERYRDRGLFYSTTGNWQKCVEEYTQLIDRYPSDRTGLFNLSGCLAQLRNLPKAVEAARRTVEIVPTGATQRQNLSFLSSFSGDFRTGEREARTAIELSPSSEILYLTLAEAQLGQGQTAQAAETYRKLEKLSGWGASLAAAGLADVASYDGRFADAARMLEEGAKADLAARRPEAAASKFAALANVHLCRQRKQEAVAAAQKALAANDAVSIRFLAARVFAEAGEIVKAQKLAASLASELNAEPQAYARIIQGKVALKRGDAREAIKAITEANRLFDTWIGHTELGRAYLEAGAFVEADSEFETCLKRHGEALELFMDNTPSYGFVPAVYYYQGRAREGLKSASFAEFYRKYLNTRDKAGEDPLLAEVRQRLGQQ